MKVHEVQEARRPEQDAWSAVHTAYCFDFSDRFRSVCQPNHFIEMPLAIDRLWVGTRSPIHPGLGQLALLL